MACGHSLRRVRPHRRSADNWRMLAQLGRRFLQWDREPQWPSSLNTPAIPAARDERMADGAADFDLGMVQGTGTRLLTSTLPSQPGSVAHGDQRVGKDPEEAQEVKVGIQDPEEKFARALAVKKVER